MIEFSNIFKQLQEVGICCLHDDATTQQHAVLVARGLECTSELVNRLISLSGGLVLVAISQARANAFGLTPMNSVRSNLLEGGFTFKNQTSNNNFLVSVEAREGVTTGISASDRATTIRALCASTPNSRKLIQPGHIFPVQVASGGVLVKNTLIEGAHDLINIVYASDGALFIDLLNSAGELLSAEEQIELSAKYGFPRLGLSSLVRHRLESECLVSKVAQAVLPVQSAGEFKSILYRSTLHNGEHLALVKGDLSGDEPVLVRVQAEQTFTDVFGLGAKRDESPEGALSSRQNLHLSLSKIEERGRGVLLYLRRTQPDYLQSVVSSGQGSTHNQVTMMREYGVGAQILRDLGVTQVELLTNSRKSLAGVKTFGIDIVKQTPVAQITV